MTADATVDQGGSAHCFRCGVDLDWRLDVVMGESDGSVVALTREFGSPNGGREFGGLHGQSAARTSQRGCAFAYPREVPALRLGSDDHRG